MKKASKTILVIEALVMIYPTLLGFLLCFGALFPFMLGDFTIESIINFFTGAIILLTLISGWRILFWVLTDEPQKAKRIQKVWWVFLFIGVALTMLAWMFVFFEAYEIYSLDKPNPTQLFVLGVYFFIPVAHLTFEVRYQNVPTRK